MSRIPGGETAPVPHRGAPQGPLHPAAVDRGHGAERGARLGAGRVARLGAGLGAGLYAGLGAGLGAGSADDSVSGAAQHSPVPGRRGNANDGCRCSVFVLSLSVIFHDSICLSIFIFWQWTERSGDVASWEERLIRISAEITNVKGVVVVVVVSGFIFDYF